MHRTIRHHGWAVAAPRAIEGRRCNHGLSVVDQRGAILKKEGARIVQPRDAWCTTPWSGQGLGDVGGCERWLRLGFGKGIERVGLAVAWLEWRVFELSASDV